MIMPQEISVTKSIIIHQSSAYLYKLWRNPEYLPQILDFLEEVTVVDEKQSQWSVVITNNERVYLQTEITEEIPSQLIIWHSGDSPYVLHQGLVRFTQRPTPTLNTVLYLNLRFYFPPIEDSRPHMLGEDIDSRIQEDLYRFKIAVEGDDFPRKKEIQKGFPQEFPGKRRINPRKTPE